MKSYIVNEIIKFQNDNIPLLEYKVRARDLRNKINNYINTELLYIKKMLYRDELSQEDYQQIKVIVEYQRLKYFQLINQR